MWVRTARLCSRLLVLLLFLLLLLPCAWLLLSFIFHFSSHQNLNSAQLRSWNTNYYNNFWFAITPYFQLFSPSPSSFLCQSIIVCFAFALVTTAFAQIKTFQIIRYVWASILNPFCSILVYHLYSFTMWDIEKYIGFKAFYIFTAH